MLLPSTHGTPPNSVSAFKAGDRQVVSHNRSGGASTKLTNARLTQSGLTAQTAVLAECVRFCARTAQKDSCRRVLDEQGLYRVGPKKKVDSANAALAVSSLSVALADIVVVLGGKKCSSGHRVGPQRKWILFHRSVKWSLLLVLAAGARCHNRLR